MTPIAEVADRILARPAPVLFVDTCNFLDLFRVTRPTNDSAWRRVDLDELTAANELLRHLKATDPILHHAVPELVPGEFNDNASDRVTSFQNWLKELDDSYNWLVEATGKLGVQVPVLPSVSAQNLSSHFQHLAELLLATATVLERDRDCVDRALARLIAKQRPSHKKEFKDSINLEQVLEVCRRLAKNGPFPHPLCFISSNTNDFADSSSLHPKLQPDFDAVNLAYFTSLRVARGHLRKKGYAV